MGDDHFIVRAANRNPDPGDVQFILDCFDSTLPYLESIGSGGQWGSAPFFGKESLRRIIEECMSTHTVDGRDAEIAIVESRVCDSSGSTPVDVAGPRHYRTDKNGKTFLLRGAALVIYGWIPQYLQTAREYAFLNPLPLFDTLATEDCLYIAFLVTDFRIGTGHPRKGAGQELIFYIRHLAVWSGKTSIVTDCWHGNNNNLINYFQENSFQFLDTFTSQSNGTSWPGVILRLRIEASFAKMLGYHSYPPAAGT